MCQDILRRWSICIRIRIRIFICIAAQSAKESVILRR